MWKAGYSEYLYMKALLAFRNIFEIDRDPEIIIFSARWLTGVLN